MDNKAGMEQWLDMQHS